MSTGTSIILDALKAAKVSSTATPVDPEQTADGLKRLQSMMQLWLSWGIVLNILPITSAGEDLNEPIDTRNAIVDNLAVNISHFYSVPVSIELAGNARVGLNMVKTLYQEVSIPDKVASSTLPRGAGNSKGIDSQNFFGRGGTIEN